MSLHHQFASEIRRYLEAAGRVVDPVNHAELADALAMVCDRVMLTQPKVITCVYCGHNYPENTPTHSHELLTAHIKTCVQHPMRALEQQLAELIAAVESFDHSITAMTMYPSKMMMSCDRPAYVRMMEKIPRVAQIVKGAADYAIKARYEIGAFDKIEIPPGYIPCRKRSVKDTVTAAQAAAKKERRYGWGPTKKSKKTLLERIIERKEGPKKAKRRAR